MRLLSIICLWGMTLLYGRTALAQTGFNIREYRTENGLPSNGLKGIQWDEQTGFLWMATEAGIVRFNGLHFSIFSNANTPFITAERMLFILRNNAGTLYSSDVDGNVVRISKNRLEPFAKVTTQSPTQPGNHFYLALSDSLFAWKQRHPSRKIYNLPYDKVLPLTDTSCFVINTKKLYYYARYANERIAGSSDTTDIEAGFKIGDSCFVLTKYNQVRYIGPGNVSVPMSLNLPAFFDIQAPGKGLLIWDNGMAYPILIRNNMAWTLTLQNGVLVPRVCCDAVPTDAFIRYAQYSEKRKLLFLGTNSKGLIVISQNQVEPVKRHSKTPDQANAYYTQLEMADGNILTSEGHILGKWQAANPDMPIEGNFFYMLSHTKDSMLWYSQRREEYGHSCLASYNYITHQRTIYPKITTRHTIVTLLANGQRLVTHERGIGYLQGDTIRYMHRSGIENMLFDVLETSPGIILMATCNGLLQFNRVTNTLDTLFPARDNCVRALWQYQDYVFFGTYGKGFYVRRNGITKAMPLDKNSYLLYAHCFRPDNKGYCWISTNKGLFKTSIAELIDAYEKNTGDVYYHYYGKNDGMDMTEMNGGCRPCALQLSNQVLSFPTMDGLLWADPGKEVTAMPDGELYIDKVVVDSVNLNPDSLSRLMLPSTTGEIMVQIGFPAWCNKENVYVAYQLNDMPGWKPINTDNESIIRFTKLPPGNYVLRIRKRNGFGTGNYLYKEISFTIAAPWYRRWWFFVLAGLTGLILMGVVFRFRTRRLVLNQQRLEQLVAAKTAELQGQNEVLEKNNTIKTKLISIISHDIVTPLKFVTVAGKKLVEERKHMPESLQDETIREMANTAQELQLLSTNILNWIKYQQENRRLHRERFNVYAVVNQSVSVLASMAKQKGIRFSNTIDPSLTLFQYFEPMKILVYNLVANAINFSGEGSICIGGTRKGHSLVLSIEDRGAGMTAEQVSHIMKGQVIISAANNDNRKGNGLGYLIIKDLLKTMEATLSITSAPGEGTTVWVSIPGLDRREV